MGEAKATAEIAAQAAAAFKRADDAFERATAARNAEVKNAEDKAKAAREAEACLATAMAAEGQAHHERGGVEANVHHHHSGYAGARYGYGHPGYSGATSYGYGYGRY